MPIISNALTLEDLPPPSLGKSGWPWTEQSQPLPDRMPDGSEWPRISIVTPNYNQGQFLEETIRSVLLQGYHNLEYIIIDGGSTDNSVEIIKKYEPYLAYWVSERDRGQSHGINKGFERCTGDYIAWMNSSDCYMPGAFQYLFNDSQESPPDFLFSCVAYGGKSLEKVQVNYNRGIKALDLKYLLRFFYSIDYIIPSQSVFVSKNLLNKVGLLNEELHYCMDLEWYVRIALINPLYRVINRTICFYRFHDDSKTLSPENLVRQESITIAYKYAVYLSVKEQRNIYRLIDYNNRLENQLGKITNSFLNLLLILINYPSESLTDRRFLGLWKRQVIQLFKGNVFN
jgi:glycosyltransferase involved in cell wall biosynthesis